MKLFGNKAAEKAAIASAEKIGLTVYDSYWGPKGLAEAQKMVENATQKLRMMFHPIAVDAIKLATITVKGQPHTDLPTAQAIFIELINRSEQAVLKAKKLADGNPAASIVELIPVWGQIKGQCKKFFTGEGKAPGSEASDNPAEYDAAAFAVELRARKGRSAVVDNISPFTDGVAGALKSLTDACAKVAKDRQDDDLIPILVEASMAIQALTAKPAQQATAASAGRREAPAPRRDADAAA